MQEFVITVMNQFGYLGILLLIAIENIFPPIPSEIILTFGGFMTTYSKMNIVGVILFSTLGSIIGAVVLYEIGRLLDKTRLEKIVSGKIGTILRLKVKDIEKADHWFDTKGNKAVFFGRCIPIVRSLISIPAGMSDMPFGKFLIYTVLGSVIWNTVLVVLGAIMGANWTKVVDIVSKYAMVVAAFLVIFIIGFACVFYSKRKNKKDK